MNTSDLKQPRQPIGWGPDNVIRFKENKIVKWMLEMGRDGQKFDLNDIATGSFSDEDLTQLMQLIGYSVSGFGDLSFVPEEEVAACDQLAEDLIEEANRPVR